MPSIWSIISTSNIYQTDETSGSPAASIRNTYIAKYIDDFLIMHQELQETLNIFSFIVQLLTKLGFLVKREKCSVAPTQEISGCTSKFLQNDHSSPRRHDHKSSKGVYSAHGQEKMQIKISSYNIGSDEPHGKDRYLGSTTTYLTISTDASKKGWGAFCKGKRTGGQWEKTEPKAHINVLGLKAALLAIQSFLSRGATNTRHLELLMDNSTAVAYPNKGGGGGGQGHQP
jgi:hypothetical protein